MNATKLLLGSCLFLTFAAAQAQTTPPTPGPTAQAECAAHPDQCSKAKTRAAQAKSTAQTDCAANPTGCASAEAASQTRQGLRKSRHAQVAASTSAN